MMSFNISTSQPNLWRDSCAVSEPLNNMSRCTAQVSDTKPLYVKIFIITVYIVIIVVAVGGNTLFSYVIMTQRKLRSVTNMFLLNLAVSDILKAIICIPFSFMPNVIYYYWPYGELMCPVVCYTQVSCYLYHVTEHYAPSARFLRVHKTWVHFRYMHSCN